MKIENFFRNNLRIELRVNIRVILYDNFKRQPRRKNKNKRFSKNSLTIVENFFFRYNFANPLQWHSRTREKRNFDSCNSVLTC